MKILIADDHAVVRGGLRQFLADAADFQLIGEASTGEEVLTRVGAEAWDLLLLDIGLPDINGLEVLRRVKRTRPGMHVLVFSMHAEDDYAMTAIEAGAIGYLPKDSNPDEILAAIRRGVRGERYLSPQFTETLLAGALSPVRKQPHEILSDREISVLVQIGCGKALTEIGEALHISPKTVSTYRTRIMEKLNLRNNAEITRYVIEHHLGT